MKIKINDRLVSELKKNNIFLRPFFHFEGSVGTVVNINNPVEAEEFSRIHERSLSWGGGITIGAFSYVVPGAFLPNTVIGRFCSIATGVRIMSPGHPVDRVTTSTWTYGENVKNIVRNAYGVEIKQDRDFPKINKTIIRHDVWVGEFAVIKAGITLNEGSVVAAQSVVTKDVPPYAIVAGNPAKIVKYRFEDSVIKKLTNSKWWDACPSVLANISMLDPSKFVDDLEVLFENSSYKVINLQHVFQQYGSAVS